MWTDDEPTIVFERTSEPAPVRAFRDSLVRARHTLPERDLDDAILLVNLGHVAAAAALAREVARDRRGFLWSDVRSFARRLLSCPSL